MAVQSINTLQNKDNYNTIAQEYLLESLANLGQRYNVKGDSISVAKLPISTLFNVNDIPGNANDYLVKIGIEDNEYSIQLINKSSLTVGSIDSSTALSDPEPKQYDDLLGDSDYNHVFLISSEGNSTYNLFSAANNNGYWFTETVSKTSGNLKSGVRILKKNDGYLLLHFVKNDSLYKVSFYFASTDNLTDSDIFDLINSINTEYKTTDTINLDGYWSNVIKNTTYFNAEFTDANNFILYDSNNDEINIQGLSARNFSNLFNNSYVKKDEITSIINLSNDVSLYITIDNIHSEVTYGNLEGIYEKILIGLHRKIFGEYPDAEDCLYIPLYDKDGDFYYITYTYNINKQEEVYFAGKEIEVRFVEADIDSEWMDLNLNDYRGAVIAHSEDANKISFYFFESDFKNNKIDDIIISKVSTLPYIDNDGYWIINEDINTGIRARGEDAGNPNIIIVETTNSGEGYNLLAGAKKEEILRRLPWTKLTAKVEPPKKINLYGDLSTALDRDYFNVECSVPDLNDSDIEVDRNDYLTLLQNSLIICISTIENEIYGDTGIITTFWVLNEDTNTFEYLRKNDGSDLAADFNYFSNADSLIKYVVENIKYLNPDNYQHRHVVFNGINVSPKNNPSNESTYVYPTIVNKIGSEYNSEYNNDFNFVFKYNDTLTTSHTNIEDDKIDSITNNGSKYLSVNPEENTNNTVTNSLYKNTSTENFEEYIPNYNVPSLDLGEVLTRNETLLNRLNILSIDSTGTTYLSYVGTSVDDSNKNILTIGTSDTNVNISSDTLINSNDRSSFIQQDTLNINFPKVNINGETNVSENLSVGKDIYVETAVWHKDYDNISEEDTSITDNTYFTSIYTPASRYIFETNDNYDSFGSIILFSEDNYNNISEIRNADIESAETNLSKLLSIDLYNYAKGKNKLFVIGTYAEYIYFNEADETTNINKISKYMIYYSDGIYLPILLNQLGLSKYMVAEDLISGDNINVTSNMDIICVNNVPLVLLSSSTNLLPNYYTYESDGEHVSDFTGKIFTCNPLKITYYVNDNKLYINIDELYNRGKYALNKKIMKNYTI